MSAQPNLRLVNEDSGEWVPFTDGEIADLQHRIDMLETQLKKAEADANRWRWKHEELLRDKEAEAKKDALWPDAVRAFKLYKRLTGRKRLGWNAERFEQVRPFLSKFGIGMVERAIVGRVFDHFTTRRANGSTKHHWDWSLIFRDADHFEESCNRAPVPFVSELEAEDELRAQEAGE